MQGVGYTSDEKTEFKRRILTAMMDGLNVTLTAACAIAKVSRTAVYGWRDEDPEFSAAITKAQKMTVENGLDLAEAKLMKKIHEEDRKSILYFLDRKGGDRGYSPKVTSINMGPDGLPLPPPSFNAVLVKMPDADPTSTGH